MKRACIKDVAREAGVSATTVSYVLNNNPGETISADTRAKVWAAVKSLNYVPNLNARSLSSRRSNLIGVVIPQTEPGREFMFANPFYGELLSSIEYTARVNDYHLLLSGTEANQSYIHIARTRGVDGIIIVGTYPSTSLEELKQMDIPVVLIDSYVNDDAFHTIGIEDKAGARMATEYLLGKGHRRIAFISGSLRESGVNAKRYEGYLDALHGAGLAENPEDIYSGTIDFEYGVRAAHTLFRGQSSATAAFVTADVLGMGLVKGLHQIGKSVPRDLSVVSFDDVNLAQMCDPSLTTIHQDIGEKGRRAVEMIIKSKEESPRVKQELILPLTLVERASVREWTEGRR